MTLHQLLGWLGTLRRSTDIWNDKMRGSGSCPLRERAANHERVDAVLPSEDREKGQD